MLNFFTITCLVSLIPTLSFDANSQNTPLLSDRGRLTRDYCVYIIFPSRRSCILQGRTPFEYDRFAQDDESDTAGGDSLHILRERLNRDGSREIDAGILFESRSVVCDTSMKHRGGKLVDRRENLVENFLQKQKRIRDREGRTRKPNFSSKHSLVSRLMRSVAIDLIEFSDRERLRERERERESSG